MDGLKKVYAHNCIKPRKHWNFRDAMRFMTDGNSLIPRSKKKETKEEKKDKKKDEEETDGSDEKHGSTVLDLHERYARLCYALCKQRC